MQVVMVVMVIVIVVMVPHSAFTGLTLLFKTSPLLSFT